MSQGRLSRSFWLQFLLVVLAIQGITPDAQDLASSQALRLFAPILTDFDTPVQEDEWPDDVCDPVQSATSHPQTPREVHGCSLTFELAIIRAQLPPIALNRFRIGARRSVLISATDLLRSFGRLNC
jgi:hypothetical protein